MSSKPCCIAMLPLIAMLPACTSLLADPPDTARAGDWAVQITERGLVIHHKGELLCVGSYFNIFNPDYKGSLVGSRGDGRVSVSPDGRTVTREGKGPQGRFTYAAEVSDTGVRVTARVAIDEGAIIGPVEYAAFQFPAELVDRARVEMANATGAVVHSQPVPLAPVRGSFAPADDALAIKTTRGNIIVSALSPASIYPFDARVPEYGKQQGVWAFTSIPVVAGTETTSVIELSVEPPDPPPVEGTIRLAPDVVATAVATATDPSDRETLAADELIEYLCSISGRRLQRTEIADAIVPRGVIAVGRLATEAGIITREDLDAVARDGYVVKVAQGRAGVCGPRDLGTVYGAYALLGRLGVKFYAPGCETVPKIKDLTIPECALSAGPVYEFRNLARNLKLGHTPADDMGNPRDIGEPGSIVHAADYLLPFDKYGDEHPEYFALQKDGERLHHKPGETRFDVHLCLSNPDVRRICAERLLSLIEQQPDRTFFGVSQGDGHAWCECERCKALDAVPGVEMTDRLLHYVNHIAREVAKQYPEKRILTLAYTNATSPPPVKVTPEPNVMVQFCPYPGRVACQSHDLTCERNRRGFADLKGWIAKCPDNMYIFDYPRGYKIYYEPFGSFYAMERKLDFYAANGIRGIYYCGTPTTFHDLFIFVQSKLLWDPGADVEALIDEFMGVYYGPAAPHMRTYFDFMHREVEDRQVHQMCEGANPGLATADYVRKALEMFDSAEAAVARDRVLSYRVRAEKLCLLFADVNERNPINGKLVEDEEVFAHRFAEFLDIARTMKIRALVRRESVNDWLYRTARIRADRKPWYADPMIDRLINKPVATLEQEQQLYSQRKIPGGYFINIDGFLGGRTPAVYGHNCPPRYATWIYGTNTGTPAMWVAIRLDEAPHGDAKLALVAQDDDKPGATRIKITINGENVFVGPNPFRQDGWSDHEFAIPAGALKEGRNELRIETLDQSVARDAGWFMLAECRLIVRQGEGQG